MKKYLQHFFGFERSGLYFILGTGKKPDLFKQIEKENITVKQVRVGSQINSKLIFSTDTAWVFLKENTNIFVSYSQPLHQDRNPTYSWKWLIMSNPASTVLVEIGRY